MARRRRFGYGDVVPGYSGYHFRIFDKGNTEELPKTKYGRRGYWFRDADTGRVTLTCPACGHFIAVNPNEILASGKIKYRECMVCPPLYMRGRMLGRGGCGTHFFAVLSGWRCRVVKAKTSGGRGRGRASRAGVAGRR